MWSGLIFVVATDAIMYVLIFWVAFELQRPPKKIGSCVRLCSPVQIKIMWFIAFLFSLFLATALSELFPEARPLSLGDLLFGLFTLSILVCSGYGLWNSFTNYELCDGAIEKRFFSHRIWVLNLSDITKIKSGGCSLILVQGDKCFYIRFILIGFQSVAKVLIDQVNTAPIEIKETTRYTLEKISRDPYWAFP